MQEIIYDNTTGYVRISDQFNISSSTSSIDATPYFTTKNQEYTLSFINLQNVKKFTKFNYNCTGIIESRYLETQYRVSRNGTTWTEWLELEQVIDNFPIFDSKDPMFIDIKWIRKGSSNVNNIRLLEYVLEGELEIYSQDGEATIILTTGNDVVIKPPFIYKVFRIDDIEIITNNDTSDYTIKYRFSQDSERTWSNWEILTKENISTVRINPIRFFQIEYLIENTSSTTVKIFDVNLIGDFQNVTNDYFKTNLYGIRECCKSNIINGVGFLGGQACPPNVFIPMTADEKAKLFNPYQQNNALLLLNKLSNDAQQVFGFTVEYFVTDPDKKGQDHTLHEYQLYNIVCSENIKVSVEGNNFPDNQITMNQFDLNLFETMEVHITKELFKQAFGPQRRPSKEDFLYFCDVNRMYQVDHAQQFRSFNNNSIYYKLILKKYTQKANVQAGTQDIKDRLKQLTKNSTIDELFGIENNQDKASIANKDQFKPLTRDPIRFEYLVSINKELIENSNSIISKSNYELSSATFSTDAVIYKNLDPLIRVSDNFSFMMWFNINNYTVNDTYNFFTYRDTTNNLGWETSLEADNINFTINSDSYTFSLSGSTASTANALEEETWYCYLVNVNQRDRKINQYIYKRNVDDESDAPNIASTVLKQVYFNQQDFNIVEYELESTVGKILASDMKATNIRLFIDVIPENLHSKMLNQYTIGDDSKYLVFADNATTRLYLPNFPLGNS